MVDLNGRTVLVTGGAGFIGSNFIEMILKKYTDITVYNFDKRGVGAREIFPGEWDWKGVDGCYPGDNYYFSWPCDLTDASYLEELMSHTIKTFDYVFHFAAESHVDRSINGPVGFIENNVVGISNLLNSLRVHHPKARVLNISTDEVYGHLGLDDAPFTEESPLHPRSPYSASKAAADLIALAFHETYEMNIVTTRCCNNFGPHQHFEKFIPTVIKSLVVGEKIPVYGTGENIREWIHVDDHNKSLLEICETGIAGKVYNIGSGIEKTNLDMIKVLVKEVKGDEENWKDYCDFVMDRQGHDFRYAIDSILYERGFEPTSFSVGVSKTVDHYQTKISNSKTPTKS